MERRSGEKSDQKQDTHSKSARHAFCQPQPAQDFSRLQDDTIFSVAHFPLKIKGKRHFRILARKKSPAALA